MKEENKIGKIVIGAIIAILVVILIISLITLGKENKEKKELQNEINKIKDAIELPLDDIPNDTPDQTLQTDM